MLAHGWRPHGGQRTQRDTAPKLIVIDFAEIQNWGRCRWPVANCPTKLHQWKAGSMAQATVLPNSCWGNRVGWVYPTQSPLFKLLAGDTLTPGSDLMPQGDKKDEEEEDDDDK